MTSAKIQHHLHRRKLDSEAYLRDSEDTVSDDSPSSWRRRVGEEEKTPAGYKHIGCFKHDWSDNTLEYGTHGRRMTTEVSVRPFR